MEEHEILTLLATVDTLGTIGFMAVTLWLFVRGDIISSRSVDSLCQQSAQEAIQELQERGQIIPPPRHTYPTSYRNYSQLPRDDDEVSR